MQLVIPPGDFKGFIFDCDGTLADSMPAHFLAWTGAYADHNAPYKFDEEKFYYFAGRPTRQIVELLNEEHGSTYDPDAFTHHKEMLFLKHLSAIKPITPVIDFARRVKAQGFPVSVASGGMRNVVDETLKIVGAADLFDIVITPVDVVHGKPAPDMFLLAAERMGIPAADCLVFEDGEMGFQAANAAGMKYVVVDSRVP